MDFFEATEGLKAIDAEIEAHLVDDDDPPRAANGVAQALLRGAPDPHMPRQMDPIARALLGAQLPAHGAFAPTAPVPGDMPPPGELRSYAPSPSESAGLYAHRGAEAIGIPSPQAQQFGSGVSGAVGLLTPADDVSGAIGTGSAGDAALAGFSLIPGFKGGKKAAEAALPALKEEVSRLMSQYASLTGKSRPLPAGFEPAEKQVEGLNELKTWLTKEIEARAARPQSRSSVPITTSPQQEEVLRYIRDNPHTQAIKGRQGFPTKAEQEQLAREYFRGGGAMPPAPWGHSRHSATEDVRRVLSEAYAKGKRLSSKDRGEIEGAAKKADEAGKEVAALQGELGSRRQFRTAREMADLRSRLDRAEKNAAFWFEQYKKIKKQHFGD